MICRTEKFNSVNNKAREGGFNVNTRLSRNDVLTEEFENGIMFLKCFSSTGLINEAYSVRYFLYVVNTRLPRNDVLLEKLVEI